MLRKNSLWMWTRWTHKVVAESCKSPSFLFELLGKPSRNEPTISCWWRVNPRDEVLLDKIWRCTVDEDEKGISLDKPGPEYKTLAQLGTNTCSPLLTLLTCWGCTCWIPHLALPEKCRGMSFLTKGTWRNCRFLLDIATLQCGEAHCLDRFW